MGKLGFRDNGSPYVYEEIGSVSSAAIGLDAGDSGKLKVVVSTNPNATPGGTPLQMTIDPSTNGDITFTPNGSGNVVVGNGDVDIQAGNLDLPASNAPGTQGYLLINSSIFLSNLGSGNVFVGPSVANLTLNTTMAQFNTLVGTNTATGITTAPDNCSLGSFALQDLVDGEGNVAVGVGALQHISAGVFNIGIGSSTGNLMTTGTESSNILIGNRGVNGESNAIRIGVSGSSNQEQDATYIAGIYGVTPAGGGLNMATIDMNGQLGSQSIPSSSISITGDSGGALTGSAFTFTGGSTGLTFAGSGATETLGGTLAIANGGTNATSMATTDGVVYYDGTRLVTTAVGTATQVLTSNGAGVAPTFQAAGGGGMTWTDITGATVALAVANGYIMNRATLITATLPASAAEGSIIALVGKGIGGWIIAQNSGQTIHFGTLNTTTGATGTLASTAQYDCVEIICTTTDTDFVVRSSIGNLTVV